MTLTRLLKLAAIGLVLTCGLEPAASEAGRIVIRTRSMQRLPIGAHRVVSGGGITWLNPQPEPPLPVTGVLVTPGSVTWLNPQPEPPRPVTGVFLYTPQGITWLNPQPEPPMPAKAVRFWKQEGVTRLNPQPEPSVSVLVK